MSVGSHDNQESRAGKGRQVVRGAQRSRGWARKVSLRTSTFGERSEEGELGAGRVQSLKGKTLTNSSSLEATVALQLKSGSGSPLTAAPSPSPASPGSQHPPGCSSQKRRKSFSASLVQCSQPASPEVLRPTSLVRFRPTFSGRPLLAS